MCRTLASGHRTTQTTSQPCACPNNASQPGQGNSRMEVSRMHCRKTTGRRQPTYPRFPVPAGKACDCYPTALPLRERSINLGFDAAAASPGRHVAGPRVHGRVAKRSMEKCCGAGSRCGSLPVEQPIGTRTAGLGVMESCRGRRGRYGRETSVVVSR